MFGSRQRADDRPEDNEHPVGLRSVLGSSGLDTASPEPYCLLGTRRVVLHYVYAFYSLNSLIISKMKNQQERFLSCLCYYYCFKLSL